MTIGASFVFLEVLDPDVNALFAQMKEIITGKRPSSPVHLTLRGPYEESVPAEVLERCRSALKYDVIRIGGVSRFSNPGEEVIFFKVDSPNLRNVWWKPDFPMDKYGFAPHLSVYRGHDGVFADRIAEFLEREELVLLCAEHQVVTHRTGQLSLFPLSKPRRNGSIGLTEAGRVGPTFVERLRELVAGYKREHGR